MIGGVLLQRRAALDRATPLRADGAFDVYDFAGTSQVAADLFGSFSK
ncbi:hypothetical protein [Kitasatospora kazusensis]